MEMFGFGVPNKIRDIVGPKEKLDVVSMSSDDGLKWINLLLT